MKTETRFESELCKTVNNLTGKIYYYVKICDVFTRISKTDYDERRDQAFGVSCLFNTTSKKFNRFYTTVTYYV